MGKTVTETKKAAEAEVTEPKRKPEVPRYLVKKPFYRKGRYVAASNDDPKRLEYDGEPSSKWEPLNEEARKALVELAMKRRELETNKKSGESIALEREIDRLLGLDLGEVLAAAQAPEEPDEAPEEPFVLSEAPVASRASDNLIL
ncbi:MAG: hypothetical protein P1V51_22365 [Deltaproteobacteria bacterium]|nr:hypothetical protein [Deltaproteobacteria bacterium]